MALRGPYAVGLKGRLHARGAVATIAVATIAMVRFV